MTLESLTSMQFWTDAVIVALADLLFVSILIWRIPFTRFSGLRWTLAGVAALSWGLFTLFLMRAFWDSYYRYFYPAWFGAGGIFLAVPLVFAGLALAFHWLAVRIPGKPLVVFCVLGGAESVLEHIWGIYRLHILDITALREVAPASILVFSFFEYVFYWCVVIALAALVQAASRRLARRPQTRTGSV